MEIPLIITVAVIALAAISGIRIVPENQRLVIFRLGKLHGVRGPGLLLVVPLVDKGVIVDLNQAVPGWQALSEQQLNDRIITVALGTPMGK